MSLSWPWALLGLLAVPLLLAARWWLNRRRKRTALTVSSVADSNTPEVHVRGTQQRGGVEHDLMARPQFGGQFRDRVL